MDVPPPPPPLPLQVGEQTPEHFRVIREDAKRNQEEHNARIERRTARALEGMNALEAGELALLKLVEPGVNRSNLARVHEIVMVKECHGRGRYTVITKHGVVDGRFVLGDGLARFDGTAHASDLGFDSLEEGMAAVGATRVTLGDLAAASNVREAASSGVGCKCRTVRGRKCLPMRCPCALAGVACSRACHKNGCCMNWTLSTEKG
ncbi:hypothetical protein RI054_03g15020 [Pseudoscourfieldia marina]